MPGVSVFWSTLNVTVAEELLGVAVSEPDEGLTCNHAPPLCWITEVVNVGLCAAGPVSVRVMGEGSAPPCSSVKFCPPVGDMETELEEVMVSEIGMVVVLLNRPCEVTWMDPV